MQSDDPSVAVPRAPDAGLTAAHRADPAVEAEGSAAAFPSPREVPTPPTPGDPVVDSATADLATAQTGSLSQRIDAGEQAHRVLQERLSDLSATRDPGGR